MKREDECSVESHGSAIPASESTAAEIVGEHGARALKSDEELASEGLRHIQDLKDGSLDVDAAVKWVMSFGY